MTGQDPELRKLHRLRGSRLNDPEFRVFVLPRLKEAIAKLTEVVRGLASKSRNEREENQFRKSKDVLKKYNQALRFLESS